MPPFLLAAALAFWGWRSGNYAAATMLAVLAEAPRWITLRFDLRHEDLTRVATLCTAVFVGMLGWLFLTVEPPRTARAVLTSLLWLPAVLAPLLVAQQLSSAGRVPLSTLFRYLRKLKERDPWVSDPAVDLRSVYFALCLVAGGIPNERDQAFYVAVVVLVGAGLAAYRPAHVRWGVWGATLGAAAILGFAAHRGLNDLQTALEDWVSEWFVSGFAADPYRSSTDLGAVGRLKMVESIVLRVYADRQDVERLRLLHRASFTALHGRTWVARGAPMTPLQPLADGTTWPLAEGEATGEGARIVTRLDHGRALLALPAGTVQVSSMAAAQVKRNALGAVQAELGGDWAPYVAQPGAAREDYAPPRAEDLQLPEAERATFRRLAEEIGLRADIPPAEALRRVREHFAGFSYSTYRESAVAEGTSPLADFVGRSRSGHCEYFAAATTLLLRAAGVPARYATGFAVTEYSALEEAFVVRARHAHAWSRAFVDGRWIDVDTTPPSWIEEEARAAPAWQKLADFLRWAGFRWAQRGELQASPAWYGVLALLVAVFAWRMLRGKRAAERSAVPGPAVIPRSGTDSEFFELERRLSRRYGASRGSSEPPAAWIARLSLDGALAASLGAALDLHERYRFDPRGLSAAERGELRVRCAAVCATLD
ncbi:MAG: transglutaminase-like domain-containing protein [Betaproteobacteria bacterium]